jgi:hypothetical protein
MYVRMYVCVYARVCVCVCVCVCMHIAFEYIFIDVSDCEAMWQESAALCRHTLQFVLLWRYL